MVRQRKEVAGEDYATMKRVARDQKNRARESWSARSEPTVNAKISLKALRDDRSEEVNVQVNFAKCLKNIAEDEEKDTEEETLGASHDGPDCLGASNDGPGCLGASHGGPAEATHPRSYYPKRKVWRSFGGCQSRSETDFQSDEDLHNQEVERPC